MELGILTQFTGHFHIPSMLNNSQQIRGQQIVGFTVYKINKILRLKINFVQLMFHLAKIAKFAKFNFEPFRYNY